MIEKTYLYRVKKMKIIILLFSLLLVQIAICLPATTDAKNFTDVVTSKSVAFTDGNIFKTTKVSQLLKLFKKTKKNLLLRHDNYSIKHNAKSYV